MIDLRDDEPIMTPSDGEQSSPFEIVEPQVWRLPHVWQEKTPPWWHRRNYRTVGVPLP